MHIYKYMPDCCDHCCDCDRADPQKDKVLIGKVFANDSKVAPTAPEDKVFAKEPMFVHEKDPASKNAATPIGAKPTKSVAEVPLTDEARRKLHNAQAATMLQRRQEEELREMQRAQEVADAAAAQEVIEAQELSAAFEASLREYEKQEKKAQRERAEKDTEDAKRFEQEREQRRKEEQEDQGKVDAFLKRNKFSDVHNPKSSFFKASYPLHCAVSKNDPDMVQLLLAAGASPFDKNSAGLTPLALAQKLDRKGSHAQILKLLRFGAEEPGQMTMRTES